MRAYIARRALLILPTMVLVTFIVFTLVRLLPGDVVTMMVEQYGYAKGADQMRQQLGLDKPFPVQYTVWIGNLVRGDFGVSLYTKHTAAEELSRRVPVTIELGVLAILFSLIISIPVGVLAAIRQDSIWDYIARSTAIVFLSVPGFWLATMVIVFGSLWLGYSPSLGYHDIIEDPLENLKEFLIPAAILGSSMAASVMRMTRAMMLEVLRQDYVRTAWAKGLREFAVIVRHALKNALIPVITIIGLQVPVVVGGSIIMEQIFGLPGMGSFMLASITYRDYPMVQAVNLYICFMVIVVNLLVDASYGYLDPKIRFR